GGSRGGAVWLAGEPIGGQLALLHRRDNRAARLRHVRAIAEAAMLGARRDVGEGRLDATLVLEQAELAHAGRIDQHAAFGELDELARGGRVAAAIVVA